MKAAVSILILSFLLTGCWDLKAVQDTNIVTALGIDYVKDHYVIYAKLTDFAAVGAKESGGESKPASNWIGIGEGPTVIMAINDMYRSAQHHTLWTHVKAIVISESALGRLEDIFDSLLRSRELRYTAWVYGTKKPIPSLFLANTTLNQSPLMLELFEPKEVYKQRSAIHPIELKSLVNCIREPATNVLLPDLSITDRKWIANQKEKPAMLELTGVFVINKGHNEGWLPENQVTGSNLIRSPEVYRFPLDLTTEKNRVNTLNLAMPHAKISLAPTAARPLNVDIRLTMYADVLESHTSRHMPEAEMELRAESKLKKQIIEEFTSAQREHIDLFGLEEWLYRHHYDVWKREVSRGPLLPKFTIGSVKVKVNIKHSNTYTT
ncbi:Ger(x)C family spore germination protein [Paenibacillus cellulositrophicus]|uniref:Ger(x)C family spore germination protein n=1 Tax=Paenibacillus cellulositrophicus TaxID=562959 RepID=UPI003F7F53BB